MLLFYCGNFSKKSFLIIDDVNVALWEWDGDAIGVQCVVNHFLGAVGVSDALRRKDELLHTDFDAAVAKLAEYHINAFLRLHHIAPVGILGAQHLHGLQNDFTHALDVGAVGHAHCYLEEFVGVALGQVGETLGEQVGIEEGNRRAIDGLHLGALVTDVGDRSAHAIALNPVADFQAARHELDAIDEVVDDVLEGQTDTSRETACHKAQRTRRDVHRDDDNDGVNHPNHHTDNAVAQREVDFVLADALAVVFAEERGITALTPEVVDGLVRIAEDEHEA